MSYLAKNYNRKNISFRYGKGSYVAITGPSSGMGKRFAIEFAKRGLNLFLIGSPKTKNTKAIINRLYPHIDVRVLEVDFCDAYNLDFFDPIQKTFDELDISIMINNVGHRSGWRPYHEMPAQKINDTIICGTIVQAQLTKMAINKFLTRKRPQKSALVFVTAQNSASVGNNPIRFAGSDITIPFLSVYEAANTFGYVHAESIFKEYTKIAIEKNVFGAPTFIIDDQIYWGQDRLDFIERHLLKLIKSQ